MKLSHLITAFCITLSFILSTGMAQAGDLPGGVVKIPYQKFVLKNGLRLIVHEDHKAPIVAVNVWYDVGSADEKPGKTGFAHLFEHLMFNGSENYNDDYFKPFDRVGATGMNGTTNEDRTNYFEVVPKTALNMALWMESDRMGHLDGAIDQARLDEQRGVVKNEKRQGENQPYGKANITIQEHIYPAGHPYSHAVIGSMADLDAATLDDVHTWFDTYYGAANAVIVVAGDVDPLDVKRRVERYFGDIPSGPPLIKPVVDIAKRTESTRYVMYDRVPQARVYIVWNVPEFGDPDVELLDILSDVLSSGKSSRLYKRLVYDDQIATDVSAGNYTSQLGGAFMITATVQPGGDPAAVEKAINEELQRVIARGIGRDELKRSKTSRRAAFIRGLERVGGFGGKSDILAMSEVYYGSPDGYAASQARVINASARQVQAAARKWLSNGDFTLEVKPFPRYSVEHSRVDRSKGPPLVRNFPAGKFPAREHFALSNGLNVILAHRTSVPVLELNMLFNAGYASDQFGLPGTASLALNMLDEGTTSRTALEISDTLNRLGATLNTDSNLDVSSVSMSALKENLDQSLDLFADVILNPAFPVQEFRRLKRQQLAGIRREKKTPIPMALRVFPRLLYGRGHAYSMPLTGSGTEASVAGITVDALRRFHATWLHPNNATLIIVGDATREELQDKLEHLFARWKPGVIPKKNLARVEQKSASEVYIVDRRGSKQSIIFTGHLVPPKSDPGELALDTVNQILGGAFTSRINMNLREDKHWSYGAQSLIYNTAAQRPFLVVAAVQTDKTSASMAEVEKELIAIRNGGGKPPTADELARAKDQKTLTLPGRWETNDAVLNDIVEMVRFSLPENYWATYAQRVRGVGLPDVTAQANRSLHPNRMVWVIVGDRDKIEPGIKKLRLGEIHYIDADGNPVAAD